MFKCGTVQRGKRGGGFEITQREGRSDIGEKEGRKGVRLAGSAAFLEPGSVWGGSTKPPKRGTTEAVGRGRERALKIQIQYVPLFFFFAGGEKKAAAPASPQGVEKGRKHGTTFSSSYVLAHQPSFLPPLFGGPSVRIAHTSSFLPAFFPDQKKVGRMWEKKRPPRGRNKNGEMGIKTRKCF